jgi:hypothetical protein
MKTHSVTRLSPRKRTLTFHFLAKFFYRKFGDIFPKKLAKLVEYTLEKKIPKNSQILL